MTVLESKLFSTRTVPSGTSPRGLISRLLLFQEKYEITAVLAEQSSVTASIILNVKNIMCAVD